MLKSFPFNSLLFFLLVHLLYIDGLLLSGPPLTTVCSRHWFSSIVFVNWLVSNFQNSWCSICPFLWNRITISRLKFEIIFCFRMGQANNCFCFVEFFWTFRKGLLLWHLHLVIYNVSHFEVDIFFIDCYPGISIVSVEITPDQWPHSLSILMAFRNVTLFFKPFPV